MLENIPVILKNLELGTASGEDIAMIRTLLHSAQISGMLPPELSKVLHTYLINQLAKTVKGN